MSKLFDFIRLHFNVFNRTIYLVDCGQMKHNTKHIKKKETKFRFFGRQKKKHAVYLLNIKSVLTFY